LPCCAAYFAIPSIRDLRTGILQSLSTPVSQANWRELVVSEFIRKAEDIDADAIIGLDYDTDSIVPIEGTGMQLKRILATGVAVKLSCAA
jgi:uncharacterized protein YbjQ (UPF0145 family)